MRQRCEDCQDKLVFVLSEKSKWYGSGKGASNHTLCRRCYRSLLSRVVAGRLQPKPFWAYAPRCGFWKSRQHDKQGMNDDR